MIRLFGIVPLGIGLTVLGFLWLSPFGEFHSPPLFFRIFGSFVALPFVFMGAGALFMSQEKLTKRLQEGAAQAARGEDAPPQNRSAARGQGYTCPSCSAPLAPGADVSPKGDVKCGHCNRWFNIHE
ncbi:MAG: hypothetical protein KF774_08290 [Planctomyces sp.]|nr:hypothetical protein [Planctomyces sp.]